MSFLLHVLKDSYYQAWHLFIAIIMEWFSSFSGVAKPKSAEYKQIIYVIIAFNVPMVCKSNVFAGSSYNEFGHDDHLVETSR